MRVRHIARVVALLAGPVATPSASNGQSPGASTGGPEILTVAPALDIEATGRLFDRGLPVTDESFSPDGFHFAYLHHVPGGFLRRKPERCAFLLDLATGDNRPTKAPKGRAARLGGWEPSGRYFLLETIQPDFFSALTGKWNTYHWIYDVVTSEFIPRKPFTGRRDGRRFLWKQKGSYHGAWNGETDGKVWPLYDGELLEIYRERESRLAEEDERRLALAKRLGVGTGDRPTRILGEVLVRLDSRWTQRGQRDPVISELFGERPALFHEQDGRWLRVRERVEHVAVLDRSLALVTGANGEQAVFLPELRQLLPIPAPPPGFSKLLQERWDRANRFYSELDPLPRDPQYRRSFDVSQGVGFYFNYVTPGRTRLLTLYSFSPERRVLRIVELPEAWRTVPRPAFPGAAVGTR